MTYAAAKPADSIGVLFGYSLHEERGCTPREKHGRIGASIGLTGLKRASPATFVEIPFLFSLSFA